MGEKKKKGSISYAKWGYIFIAPFFIIFAVFQLIPLASTIYYSFFEYYRSGLKMFDVPQILTNGKGGPDRTSTTMIMYLNNHLFSKNYGMAGAVSVVLFLVCAVLCVVVYFSLTKEDDGLTRAQRKELNAAKKAAKGGK